MRKKSVAVGVAVVALGVALLPLLLLRGARDPGPDDPPWQLPELVGSTHSGEDWHSAELADQAAVLIYVDYECPFCKTELAEWARLEADSTALASAGSINLRVIASARSPQDDLHWLPGSFHGRTVWDTERTMASLLGVNAVPASFWIDSGDTVRIIGLGVTDPGELRRNIIAVTAHGDHSTDHRERRQSINNQPESKVLHP